VKLNFTVKLFMISIFLFSANLFAQSEDWVYEQKITFPEEDTAYAQPYLCTIDSEGRLYVASSKVTNLDARNAIFYADPSDTTFTKMVDYFENGEQDSASGRVEAIIGITAIDDDILISTRIPKQQIPAGASAAFYYEDADTNKKEVFGFNINGAGWGTFVAGIDANQDSVAYGGITYSGPSIRLYNFKKSLESPGYGSWFLMTSQPLDPFGAHTNGFDVIRDVALVPQGDYSDTNTVFYTSRNAFSSTSLNGGVSLWSSGSYNLPAEYQGQKVQDQSAFLQFGPAIPYGIAVDNDNKLWVAGIDSSRRWVKGFEMLGAFAQYASELPSQNSFDNPQGDGAPMISPCDVAFSPDGRTAYVIDAVGKCAYKFVDQNATNVKEKNRLPEEFALKQNYPNPFNPATMISYSIPKSAHVKITVSNSLGEEVAELVNEYQSSGRHVTRFNASDLSSGIYFYTLQYEHKQLSKKMMLLK
jgi:hypothetical protein